MLPTFLIIGAQKAATTTLHYQLRQHPEIFLPELKETNYLIDEGNWALGRAWYESLFEPARGALHRGEVSPGYTMFPFFRHAPERAAALIPEARIIYLVRNPVDRMVSGWAQAASTGLEHLDLPSALLRHAQYQLTSSYGLQVSRWTQSFAAEQLLVLRSEDLESNEGGTLDRIFVHLDLPVGWRPSVGVSRLNVTEEKHIVRSPIRRLAGAARAAGFEGMARRLLRGRSAWVSQPLAPDHLALEAELRSALEGIFKPDLAWLRQHVGPDMDLWGLA